MPPEDVTVLSQCPVCGGRNLAPLPEPGNWIGTEVFAPLRGRIGLVRCRACDLRFVNPRPARHILNAFYSGDNYSCHEAGGSASAGRKAEFLLDRIEEVLQPDSARRLLDFGCGGGAFLKHALQRGWNAYGFEPGRRGREVCTSAGLNVVGDLGELPERSFTVVTLHHVFEHLEDHASSLNELRKLLALGGLVFIEVPNVRSLRARLSPPLLSRRFQFDERYRAFPIHLNYFSKRTLSRLVKRAGWQVERSFTAGLGIEELRVKAGGAADTSERNPTTTGTSPRPRARLLKRIVKGAILGSGLGENLCMFMRPE